MRFRSLTTTLFAGVAAVSLVGVGSASATPADPADVAPMVSSCLQQASTGNSACFEDVGDRFDVYDGSADGKSAVAYWWTDYGRSGFCYNSNGAGTWATCNYDMAEGRVVAWQTCSQNVSAGGPLDCTSAVASRYI